MRLVDHDDYNVRGSSKTARVVFMVSLSAQLERAKKKVPLRVRVSVAGVPLRGV